MTTNIDRYRTYITKTGFGLEALANQQNKNVDFAVLVVGDGVLPDSENPANQTGLINQVRAYPVTIEQDKVDPTIWIARAEIPAEDGGFTINEAGVRVVDENGDLYTYARQPGDYKPELEEGAAKSYTIRLKFIPGNASVIEAKIDPSVQFATPGDIDQKINELKNEDNPFPKYIHADELSDSTSSESTETAASSKAAFDAARQFGDRKSAGIISFHPKVINKSVTIPSNVNAEVIGPEITIEKGVTLTISKNSTLTVR